MTWSSELGSLKTGGCKSRLSCGSHNISNNDFWVTKIKHKRVSANYPFHFNMINLTESPCSMLIKTAHQFANTFWAHDSNILDTRIFFSDLLKVNRTQKLTLRHFCENLPIVNQEKILSLCLKHLIILATGMMASWENINTVCEFELNDLEQFHVRLLVQQAKAEFSFFFNTFIFLNH